MKAQGRSDLGQSLSLLAVQQKAVGHEAEPSAVDGKALRDVDQLWMTQRLAEAVFVDAFAALEILGVLLEVGRVQRPVVVADVLAGTEDARRVDVAHARQLHIDLKWS